MRALSNVTRRAPRSAEVCERRRARRVRKARGMRAIPRAAGKNLMVI